MHWLGFNTAQDLKRLRKMAGLSQAELGELSGFGRHTVAYHEARLGRVDGFAPATFRNTLERMGVEVPAPGQPPSVPSEEPCKAVCGAKTRAGAPCQAKPLRSGRCKDHGGLSTGPSTEEGRARVSAAMRARHVERRKHKQRIDPTTEATFLTVRPLRRLHESERDPGTDWD